MVEKIGSYPIVSISMLTYNHEKYISQAIESILMQQVNFPYQIIIGEDASTDKTREIILEYAKQFPERFYLIFHDHNVGMTQNALSLRPFLTGKYIACLEGDDYWIDPNKLQKQVEFLDQHPEYMGVSHKVLDVNENGGYYPQAKSYFKDKVYTLKHVEQYLLAGHTSTLVYKRYFSMLKEEEITIYNACNIVGDRKLNLVLAALGGVYRMDECMSVHRHSASAWTQQTQVQPGGMSYFDYQTMDQLSKLAKDLFSVDLDFSEMKMRAWFGTVIQWLRYPKQKNWEAIQTIFFSDNKKAQKLLYLLFHIISWPYRAILKKAEEVL